jgi:hypothetical protein
MTISDGLIIMATSVDSAPSQKWLEQIKERGAAKRQIFYDLMATRATRVNFQHVQALNRIDLEFSNGDRAKDRDVVNRWRIYADHLNQNVDEENPAVVAQWNVRGDELFTDLLEALSRALGYPFDRVQLRRGIYYPRAHGQAELRREVFERAVVALPTGQTSLNMKVTEFPVSAEAVELSRRLHEGLLRALSEDGALKTRTVQ